MAKNDFQYSAEYSKSSRASCRYCWGKIEKGNLRLAVFIQSQAFDGKIPHWYHFWCFFKKQKPKSVEDISNFDALRWDDQEAIKQKLGIGEGGGSNKVYSKTIGIGLVKRIQEFFIEYAKSGRAVCRGCNEKILKGEMRISALDFESQKAKISGPIQKFRHVDCFIGLRKELGYYGDGPDLPGFNKLSSEDKEIIKEKIKPIKRGNEHGAGKEDLIKKQNNKIFSFRDNLEKNLSKYELVSLLKYNDYDVISGKSEILDTLADLMTFGNIGRCNVCKTGNLLFRSSIGYCCNGNISEWAKCTNVEEKPTRLEFRIPEKLKTHPFLEKYKYKKNGDREFVGRQAQSENSARGIKRKKIENSESMEGLVFAIIGLKDKEIKTKVESLGGKISSTIDSSTAAVFTTKSLVDKESKNLQSAKAFGVECVPKDFFDTHEPSDILMRVKVKNMAPWVKEDVISRLSKLKKLKESHSETISQISRKYQIL